MGHILGEVVLGIFVEVLWQGLGYATGSVVVPMLSLGRVQPGMWPKEAEKQGLKSDDPFFYTKGEKRFMFGNIVAASGMVFLFIVFGVVAIAVNIST